MLGSDITSITFSYPYILYFLDDIHGTGEKMFLFESMGSHSEINYAQVTILSDVTVSSKQKQMLFEV